MSAEASKPLPSMATFRVSGHIAAVLEAERQAHLDGQRRAGPASNHGFVVGVKPKAFVGVDTPHQARAYTQDALARVRQRRSVGLAVRELFEVIPVDAGADLRRQ